MNLIQYNFRSDQICIGERVKGGTYKPSSLTIPYTRISGAIWDTFGIRLHAVGVIDSVSGVNHLILSPRDRISSVSRLPLKVMYLSGVQGKIFILNKDNVDRQLADEMELYMGALRMKGMGKCFLYNKSKPSGSDECKISLGLLRTRLPVDIDKEFGISVIKPRYGYLFVREDDETGKYVLAYYEGSLVNGPELLINKIGGGDGAR